MKKITDPTFKYVPSFGTDLKKRFRAEQRRIDEQEASKRAIADKQAARDKAVADEQAAKIAQFRRSVKQ